MTGAEPSVGLEGVHRTDSAPETPSAIPAERAHRPGLAALHATLDRLVRTLDLRALTVVVDDADLGRQAFRAGPGPFEPGTLSGPPGCRIDPALPPDRMDPDLLIELCAASLRVEVLGADTIPADSRDAAELALRRIPGVRAVIVDQDDELLVVQVYADSDAATDLARVAGRTAMSLGGGRVVVEIHRDRATAPTTTPIASTSTVDLPVVDDDTPRLIRDPRAVAAIPTFVAVRSDAEAGEIEVHVRGGERRAIGRAPVAQGLTGAATATLHALRDVGDSTRFTVSWARTIETTADRRFVVAVALLRGRSHAPRHGLGSGADALEAAARATLDAVLRYDEPEAGAHE